MARYELHADYDRDGYVAGTPAEYKRRKEEPGAELVPNLDRDDRPLPRTVTDGPALDLDVERPTGLANDNEPVRLLVRVKQPIAAGSRLFLRASGPLRHHVRLLDNHRRRIPMEGFSDFPLAIAGAEQEFWLDIDAFGANVILLPFRETAATQEKPSEQTESSQQGKPAEQAKTAERAKPSKLRSVQLSLLEVAPGHASVVDLDSGRFQVPQLLILDDLATPERLYIAQADKGENEPSLRDVETVCRAIGVPVLQIPYEINNNDIWVQDQFQLAWCQTVRGARRFILHLPRTRRNNDSGGVGPNLADFVVKHFPSKDLGLIQDFWRRPLTITDVTGFNHRISLSDSRHAFAEMARAFTVRRTLFNMGHELIRSLGLSEESAEFTELDRLRSNAGQKVGVLEALEVIPLVWGCVDRLFAKAIAAETAPIPKQRTEKRRETLGDRIRYGLGTLRIPRDEVLEFEAGPSGLIEISRAEAVRVFDRLERVHDGLNYGGNIECSGPLPGQPNGKLVVGNHTTDPRGQMDADLLQFLQAQDGHEVVEVDTKWLKVGHIDEIMAFVPHRDAASGFAIARASSSLGVALIREALRLYREGIPLSHEHRNIPTALLSPLRATTSGEHPVTMMFRGKQWLHEHPRTAFQAEEPPLLFRRLVEHHGKGFFSLSQDQLYEPGPLKATAEHEEGVRHYMAHMSVLELDTLEQGANDEIETKFLAPHEKFLKERFRGVPILRLPTLVDEPGMTIENDELVHNFERTGASFVPNAVNLQVLGNVALIPRQHGPRMKPEDAAAVVTKVLKQEWPEFKRPNLDARCAATHGLGKSVCWLRASDSKTLAERGVMQVADWFADGFPRSMDRREVQRRIQDANPGGFRADGMLRDGWQRLIIPDNTVDVFEACIAAVLHHTGVRIEWVEAWPYHVHGGHIHCGTNVLRRLRRKS